MKRSLIFLLIVFSLAYIVNSCGARKKETEKKKESVKTDFSGFFRNSGNSSEFLNTSFNLQKNLLSKEDSRNEIETEGFTIKPEDSTKPAIYIDPNGKKHILINSTLSSTKKKQKIDTNSEKSEKSDEVKNSEAGKESQNLNEAQIKANAEAAVLEASAKKERDQWSLWNLLWLLLPIVLIVGAWKLYKIYKKKNPTA